MPEFPRLKNQIDQVEWNGGSTSYVVLVVSMSLSFVIVATVTIYVYSNKAAHLPDFPVQVRLLLSYNSDGSSLHASIYAIRICNPTPTSWRRIAFGTSVDSDNARTATGTSVVY